jgi:signal transduction histidine kinase/CheY-like chemotaxis protein
MDFPAQERRLAESTTTAQLHACVRDLLRLLALPAVWNGRDPNDIFSMLCETLESALGLEACYVCARVRASEPLAHVLRIHGAFVSSDHPAWQTFVNAAGSPHSGPPSMIDNTPIGSLRMVSYDMGYFGEGSLCAASTDPEFPTPIQAMILQAGVTLAASALQSARLAGEKEEALRAKEEFLALLGHELRNPLAPIVTALSLMKLRSGGELPREQQIIERQVGNLSRLVDGLQDISRAGRGKIDLAKQPVEMSEVVAKAVEKSAALIEQRGHVLKIDVPPGLIVDGDPQRLSQIVANLLTNAAKYTDPHGHIAVSASCSDDEIKLTVTDNGSGIDAQLLPGIFDLFFDGTTATERKATGLGIGLSLVKALVQLHGGRVKAWSEGPERGSEFVVTLPAASSAAAQARAPASGSPASASARHSECVLVVDDNRDAAELVGEMLVAVGHEVSVAHDALQALTLIARVKPSVVVLDIGMPIMDGYELASRIRDEFRENSPRLIAVTGYGGDQDKARSREVGIETHLVKPVTPDQLLAAVRRTVPGGDRAADD